jgi:hypothetical protein
MSGFDFTQPFGGLPMPSPWRDGAKVYRERHQQRDEEGRPLTTLPIVTDAEGWVGLRPPYTGRHRAEDSPLAPLALAEATGAWHIGRSWSGSAIEDACGCVKAACGLVDSSIPAVCDQHEASRTIRQGHPASRCPGATR